MTCVCVERGMLGMRGMVIGTVSGRDGGAAVLAQQC